MAARRKIGRARIEDRHKTNEALAPWIELNKSKRTWYRRRRERREKRTKRYGVSPLKV
jgi:hypothetical protein